MRRTLSLTLLPAALIASACAAPAPVPATTAPAPAAAPALAPKTGADVVRAMHDRYADTWYRTLAFTQATERRSPADTMVRETWYEQAKIPGALRIDVGAPTGNPVILYTRDTLYIRRTGLPLIKRATRNPLAILGFDVYRQPADTTLRLLVAEGVDTTRVHADTLYGRPVWVVGAAAGDTTSKQFWVDAGRMLFVRMLEPAQAPGGGFVDIRFENYQPAGKAWVSPLVTVTAGGKLVQRETYRDIQVDVPIPDARFDPAALGATP